MNINVTKLAKNIPLDNKCKLFWNKNISDLVTIPKKLNLIEQNDYAKIYQFKSNDSIQLNTYTLPSKKHNIDVTRKIRIYPNKQQVKLFMKCFSAHRYFYNKAIDEINNGIYSFITIRNSVVIKDSLLDDTNEWMSDVPYDTRQYGVRKAVDAFKTSLALKQQGYIDKFNLKFLSKKYSSDVFYVDKRALKNGKLFPSRLKKKAKLRSKKDIIDVSLGNFVISREKDGKYYACILVNKKVSEFPKNNQICALDPGVRCFQTSYSDGEIIKYGWNTQEQVHKLHKKIDKLTSLRKKGRTKYNIKRRIAKLRTKVQHTISNLHWQVCNDLTQHYDVILLPTFESQNMVSKPNRIIKSRTARELMSFSHYKFQEKLKYKCEIRQKTLIMCKENYTTKTCGKCGVINEKVGSNKTFKCDCGLILDRDINAARNILLKNIKYGV